MREQTAQVVLLVRAFEEVDADGIVLPAHARTAATRRALMVTGLGDWQGELGEARNFRNGETVSRRARLLFDGLRRKVPVLRGVLRIARLGAGTAPALVGLAFLLGLTSNALGPSRHVNLLSFPILGLLGWNLAMYVGLVGALLIRGADAGGNPRNLAGYLAGFFLKSALWRRLHGRRFSLSASEGERRITAKAMVRFGALWHRHAGALLAARVRRTLHLGALAMMLGVLIGLYARGLAFEYHAMWESTWLDAAQVQTLLRVVLGPAAALLGIELPDVAALEGTSSTANAAIWIHLYATTALLFVVVPRGVLASIEGWRCGRLAIRVPVDLDDAYFKRQFSAWRGATRRVDIVPYSFNPRPVALDRLKALLQDAFGARARIQVHEPLAYGAEPSALRLDAEARDADADLRDLSLIVLFNLAQSPEVEVHGDFLRDLKPVVEQARSRLLVLFDVSGYHERVRDPDRRQERLRAWMRVCDEVGLEAVDLELDRPLRDAELVELLMNSMREAMWSAPTVAEAG